MWVKPAPRRRVRRWGWGGKRLPGRADAEITCQTARSSLTSRLEIAPLTACFLLREFRDPARTYSDRRRPQLHGGSRCSFTCGRVFQMCHVAQQRARGGSRARQRASTSAQLCHDRTFKEVREERLKPRLTVVETKLSLKISATRGEISEKKRAHLSNQLATVAVSN